MFHRSVARSVALGVAVFFASLAVIASADDTGSVTVSVETESLSISITDGNVTFDTGPYGSRAQVVAHTDSSADGSPPQIENNGNVIIRSLLVDFDNSPAASCDDGAASWTAGLSPGPDIFMLRAAAADLSLADFDKKKQSVDPLLGSGNLLAGASAIPPDGSVPLLIELVTPDPASAGGGGCTIDLTVTAAAS